MPPATRAVALDELEQVASDLSSRHRELALLLQAELETRVSSWMSSDSEYVTARDRVADSASLHLTREIVVLKGEISALESRRSFLEFYIHWGS